MAVDPPTPASPPAPAGSTIDLTNLRKDITAGTVMALIAVPQGIAYAVIAGLPPATGLYAAAVPAVLGSLFRSSSHVIGGPTNALSLLVGGALLAAGVANEDLPSAALVLALMVGVFQVAAGALRLGSIVDYISRAVVLGYITGAGVLIGVGQLGNLTNTPMDRGNPYIKLTSWVAGLGDTDWRTLLVGAATVAVLLLMRWSVPKIPGALVVLAASVAVSWGLGFQQLGIPTVGDLAPVPLGLPPFTPPSWDPELLRTLLPGAIAVTVLSLVESSSVARSIAGVSGEKLDMNREFLSSGLANIGAGLFGAYPVSGSLSRSGLNHQLGAVTRFSGVASGLLMIAILLVLGPIVDHTPIAALAGLLLLVAWDLVDREAIGNVLRALWGDRLAFVATVLGTWTLPLDAAIYLGVGISILVFLRRVRNIAAVELVLREHRIREARGDPKGDQHCRQVRAIHIEGNLFFGAATELQIALDDAIRPPEVKVLVVRLKRARGLDYTTAGVLMALRKRLEAEGRHLILAGMTRRTMALFDSVGLTDDFPPEDLFPTESEWFFAMNHALERAHALVAPCDADCPLTEYLENQ